MISLSMTAYNEKSLDGFEDWVGDVSGAVGEFGFDFIEIVSD